MTRLIVISNETDLENETAIVNELFHAGLGLFHLRKPNYSLEQQRAFLDKIENQFHDKISVHQNYETVIEFDLKYYHVKENDRVLFSRRKALKNTQSDAEDSSILRALRNLSDTLREIKRSTSFHNYNDLQFESHKWDYCFFGPVFDSISKEGYKSKLSDSFHNEGDLYQRVFALGGITKQNIEDVFKKEFYGAAVLGSIWKDPSSAVKNFFELNELCKQNVHTY
jgi:thiamine-phosphate pyrophosphorylase